MAKGLGKGISALFDNLSLNELNGKEETVREVSIHDLHPNPYQPRKTFQPEAIEELKQSILQHGILQPLIVRRVPNGFEIVVGERRYRAAKEANLPSVPVVVRELTDEQMMEFALLENLQREDLNPIEEAMAYKMLMDKLHLTQEEVASRVGKSRPHIANHLRLLSLPSDVQKLLIDGTLSMGHGRALLGLKQKSKMKSIVERTIREGLNVRQLEKLIQQANENVSRETSKRKPPEKSVFIRESESLLREKFGTNVTIKQTRKRGKIEIEFFSPEDLERILELLDVRFDE
ncbi:ParB/RepB/Spo0J family partition protein [Geobacillus sp. G4]|uniref:Stage 0 sporulation protein J (Antagonist of Soj) n=5 Tax=Geobacillus TaxID=129337 RepID=Q5KU62_GEOKA|nr:MULTISPECIES: ParB/RepB/Spo0J family partition protein [Geobacillus]ALA70371.1 plasmid partitioning protein ParB [Geobacillus stearothermophilus 10]MCG6794805.1 ParB/RepB/Spo0J family partition protein [Geobacillus sp. YHL]ADI28380.1 parB-like partition protein [Geobacillus sp. C56-T3]ADU95926.1 parB-like partition protein [Geobacillus sp. Y412MC52]AEV21206.1 Stage 0 sporulation protein J [Geobacillus thermoleovorans CCB_US3_UF5]